MKPATAAEPTSEHGAGSSAHHESAHLHVTGQARYADDIDLPANTLHAALGISTIAHGRVLELDLTAVLAAPGVVCAVRAADVPGHNSFGPILNDDPVFADGTVSFAGQALFAVAASSTNAARRAARLARVTYEALPAILDVRGALAQKSFVIPTQTMRRGDARGELDRAPHRLAGSLEIGGQDHFYLEGQIAIALPQEDGAMLIHCSTQHPTEVQHKVAEALGLHAHDVVVQCRRMGGGFGGKESQPAQFACVAAILAAKTGRPVKLRLDRDVDMIITGKRHDFVADYEVGFDACGRILALVAMLASRCGQSADLSGPVNDRAMLHIDNAYFLENVEVVSHRCRTHTVSGTAFRGFGGPQGMMVIENVIDDIARALAIDPLDVRRTNLYGGPGRDTTPYLQPVEVGLLEDIIGQLETSSEYRARRARIAAENAANPLVRRGIALTPVKFGISFNALLFNQAGALVHVYTDGTVLVNHGGTEMGQGLFTKVAQIVAREFGLPLHRVRASATDTSKVPNTSATAASAGSDLNGKAAQAAAVTIRERLVAHACARHGVTPGEVAFESANVRIGTMIVDFETLVRDAYAARISLSATGYYRTPKIHFDAVTQTGCPFFYFACGAAVAEVALDTLTGETRLVQVDILHDAGTSLNPAIDIGQIEGAFLQGAGWLTCEELVWNVRGELLTHAPSTYKIPTARDWPATAHVRLLEGRPNPEDTIHRSRAVGEPPLMLGISVFQAIRDAIGQPAAGAQAGAGARTVTDTVTGANALTGTDARCGAAPPPRLAAPATPEAVLRALGSLPGDRERVA